jgi:hypothetical protein
VLLVQGGADRVIPPAHGDRPGPGLGLRRNDGRVSILAACPLAIDWLIAQQ